MQYFYEFFQLKYSCLLLNAQEFKNFNHSLYYSTFTCNKSQTMKLKLSLLKLKKLEENRFFKIITYLCRKII